MSNVKCLQTCLLLKKKELTFNKFHKQITCFLLNPVSLQQLSVHSLFNWPSNLTDVIGGKGRGKIC